MRKTHNRRTGPGVVLFWSGRAGLATAEVKRHPLPPRADRAPSQHGSPRTPTGAVTPQDETGPPMGSGRPQTPEQA